MRSFSAVKEARLDWWSKGVSAVILSGTFMEDFFSRENSVSAFYPKDGVKEHIISGATITASSCPHLVSYYPQRGREETGAEMRGDERTGAQHDKAAVSLRKGRQGIYVCACVHAPHTY